jgi:hypothetical protein
MLCFSASADNFTVQMTPKMPCHMGHGRPSKSTVTGVNNMFQKVESGLANMCAYDACGHDLEIDRTQCRTQPPGFFDGLSEAQPCEAAPGAVVTGEGRTTGA